MPFIIAADDEHYEATDVDGKHRCKHCGWVAKVSTLTIYRSHLAGEPTCKLYKVKGCHLAPPEVAEEMAAHYAEMKGNKLEKKRKSDAFIDDKVAQLNFEVERMVEAAGGGGQKTIETCFNSASRDYATRCIARFYYRFNVPFKSAESTEFKEMLRAVAKAGDGYKGPSPFRLKTQLLDAEFAKANEKKRATLLRNSNENLGLTITGDGATISKRPLTNVLALPARSPAAFLILYDDATELYANDENAKKDADYHFRVFEKAIEDVGPENVVMVITDCAPVMVAMWEMISRVYKHIFCAGCLAHQVNTFVKHVCNIEYVNSLITQVKSIVQHFNNCNKSFSIFTAKCLSTLKKKLTFIVPSDTRFGLYLLMMHRVLVVRPALLATVTDHAYMGSKGYDNTVHQLVMDNSFWARLLGFVQYMFPALRLIRIADSDMPLVSKVVVRVSQLRETLRGDANDVPTAVKNEILTLFDAEHSSWLADIHILAFCLDPEYWDENVFLNHDIMVRLRRSVSRYFDQPGVTQQQHTQKVTQFFQEYQLFRDKLGDFSLPVIQQAAIVTHMSDWYRMYASFVPLLQSVGIRVGGQRQGAGASERNWHDYKTVRTKLRSQMSSETVHKLITVKTQMLIEERELSNWKLEIAKFTEEDEFIKLDNRITASAAASRQLIPFSNYQETWEHNAMLSKNAAQRLVLLKKYKLIHFFDADTEEYRTVIDIKWHPGQRGVPAQYTLWTQKVTEVSGDLIDEVDSLQTYYINNFFYPMVTACQNNSSLNECFRITQNNIAAE